MIWSLWQFTHHLANLKNFGDKKHYFRVLKNRFVNNSWWSFQIAAPLTHEKRVAIIHSVKTNKQNIILAQMQLCKIPKFQHAPCWFVPRSPLRVKETNYCGPTLNENISQMHIRFVNVIVENPFLVLKRRETLIVSSTTVRFARFIIPRSTGSVRLLTVKLNRLKIKKRQTPKLQGVAVPCFRRS